MTHRNWIKQIRQSNLVSDRIAHVRLDARTLYIQRDLAKEIRYTQGDLVSCHTRRGYGSSNVYRMRDEKSAESIVLKETYGFEEGLNL